MSAAIEEKIEKIPIINWLARLLKKVKLSAFEGLSLYDLIEMYLSGIRFFGFFRIFSSQRDGRLF